MRSKTYLSHSQGEIERRLMLDGVGIGCVSKAVAHKVEAQDGNENEGAGYHQPGGVGHRV